MARSFGPYAKKYFRIGHLGDINDATLIGALGATEMALALAGVPHKKGAVAGGNGLHRVDVQPAPRRRRRSSRCAPRVSVRK